MEIFFNSPEYIKMKAEYETEHFKLFGNYCWYDGDKMNEKSSAQMAEYFKNKKVEVEYVETQTTKKGTTISTSKAMSKTFYQIWSEDPNMREFKEVIFNCDVKKVKPHQFNLYTGFNHFDDMKPSKVDLSPVLEHVRTMTGYNEGHYNYFLDWLAQLIQQPHILPHTTLIFISEEGIGKDIFNSFINEVIGPKYTNNFDKLELICGKFNTALGGKLLININETDPVESRNRIESLKFLITAEKVMIEGKNKDPVKSDNFCRFIFYSNRPFAFPVEQGSRRPVILNSSSKYLPINIGVDANKKYFSNLVSVFKNREVQKAFFDMLIKRDISKFNPQDFEKSELHQTLHDNSISPIVGFLAKVYENNSNLDKKRYLTTQTLLMYNEYIKEGNYKFELTQAKFNTELEFVYKIRKLKTGGSQHFEFDIPALKKMLEEKYKYNFNEKAEEIVEEEEDMGNNTYLHGKDKKKQNDEITKLKKANEDLLKRLEALEAENKELQEKAEYHKEKRKEKKNKSKHAQPKEKTQAEIDADLEAELDGLIDNIFKNI